MPAPVCSRASSIRRMTPPTIRDRARLRARMTRSLQLLKSDVWPTLYVCDASGNQTALHAFWRGAQDVYVSPDDVSPSWRERKGENG